MRTLRFIVNGQIITPDPNCDFSNLVPGTERSVIAEFIFTTEWKEHIKVAAFYSMLGYEYPPQILDINNRCIIPSEALGRRRFKIRVVGRKGMSKLATDKITISQTGGKV